MPPKEEFQDVDDCYDQNFKRILGVLFIPFSIYFVATIWFLSNDLIDDEPSYTIAFWLVAVGTVYIFVIKILQMVKNGSSFFKVVWNIIDLLLLFLNAFLLINRQTKMLEKEVTVLLATIGACLMWAVFIFWIRIFK